MDDLRLQFEVRDDGSVVLKKIRGEHKRTTDEIVRGSARAAAAVAQLRAKLPTTGQVFARMGTKIMSVAKKMAKIAVAALAAIGVASIKMAMDFEYGMAEVATLVDTSVVDMREMSSAVLEMSGKFGQAAKGITKGLYQAISAGVDATKAIEFMNVAGEAAIAGITNIDTAVDGLTTILNSYGLGVEHARRISDEMFQTVKEGKLVFADIANVIGRCSTMAANLGVESSHLQAALATLTKVGMNAHQSATAIRAIFTGLLKPTADAAAAAQRYGVRLDSAAVAQMGFAGYMRHVRTQLEANTGSQREMNEALAALFPNIRGLTGVMALGGKALGEFERITKSVVGSMGAAKTAFEKVADTAKHVWNRLKQTFKAEMIKWGETALKTVGDVLRHLVENATAYFALIKETAKNVWNVFKNMGIALGVIDPPMGKMVKKLSAVEKVSEGILTMFYGINTALIDIAAAIAYISTAFQAVNLVIKTAVLGLVLAADTCAMISQIIGKGIGGAIHALAESIEYVVIGALEIIMKLIDKIRSAIASVVTTLNKIDVAGVIPDEVVRAMREPIGGRGFIESLTAQRRAAGGEAAEAWPAAGEITLEAAAEEWKFFTESVTAQAGVLGRSAKKLSSTFWYASEGAVTAAERIKKNMDDIRMATTKMSGTWRSAIDEMQETMKKGFSVMKRSLEQAEAAATTAKTALDSAKKAAEEYKMLGDVYDEMTKKYGAFGEAVDKNTFVLGAAMLGYEASTTSFEDFIKLIFKNVDAIKDYGQDIYQVTKTMEDGTTKVEYFRKRIETTYGAILKSADDAGHRHYEIANKREEKLTAITAEQAAKRIAKLQELEKKGKDDAVKILRKRYDKMKVEYERLKNLTDDAERHIADATERAAKALNSVGDNTAEMARVAASAADSLGFTIAHIRGLSAEAGAAVKSIQAMETAAKGSQAMQSGGIVGGRGYGDRQIIRAEAGEGVVTRPAVQHYGEDFIHAINRLAVPRDEGAKELNVEVVLVPSEDFADQVITRGAETVLAIIETYPKRIRKVLGVK